MTDAKELTPEFKAQFKREYGMNMGRRGPDFGHCAEEVSSYIGRFSQFHQCTRKNGHGPEGAWCKRHDPVAVKARREAEDTKWRAKSDRDNLLRSLETEKLKIIQAIADGHNDPSALCTDYLERLGKATGKDNSNV